MDYLKMRKQLEQAVAGEVDQFFVPVVNGIHCMSRPRVYAIINAIVGALEPGELYVEVGTYQGGSLVAALTGNESRAIGVDSFSEFTLTNNREITQSNLDRFGVNERVELLDMDFRSFFAQCVPGFKITVYYYDGAHDYETQLAGMEAAWPFLDRGSIVLVDDYSYPEVNRAVNQFIANHIDRVTLQFVMGAEPNQQAVDSTWWNGVVALRVI